MSTYQYDVHSFNCFNYQQKVILVHIGNSARSTKSCLIFEILKLHTLIVLCDLVKLKCSGFLAVFALCIAFVDQLVRQDSAEIKLPNILYLFCILPTFLSHLSHVHVCLMVLDLWKWGHRFYLLLCHAFQLILLKTDTVFNVSFSIVDRDE